MSDITDLEKIRAINQSKLYFGWWILAAGALAEMLAIGSTSYAAGLFVLPLERELSISRAQANSVLPMLYCGGVVVAPFIGQLFDRYPIERIMALGALALGGGFVAISLTASIPVMVLALIGPVAAGFVAMGPLAAQTLVSRWFERRRGRALGIATVATSGGGLLVVPALSFAIEHIGWRMALLLEGVAIPCIVAGLALLVIRSAPPAPDAFEHGGSVREKQRAMPAPSSQGRWKIRDVLAARNFWTIALILGAITGVNQALVISIVPYGTGLGYSPGALAFLISAFAFSAAIVKVGSGLLAEFIDRRIIMAASAIAMTLALSVLLAFSSYTMLVVACCLSGAALGCVLPSTAALVAEYFGPASFGAVMGAIYVVMGLASIVSVPFIGAVYDRTNSYEQAFEVFIAVTIAAGLAAAFTRKTA